MFSGDIQPVVQMLDKNPAIYCNNCGKTVASLAIVIAKNDTSTAGAAVNIKKTLDGKCGGEHSRGIQRAGHN
jgi:lipoate-protein ligase B